MYQYYHKNEDCKADSSDNDDCICWRDEGTGPFPGVPHGYTSLHWRKRPNALGAERKLTHTPGPWYFIMHDGADFTSIATEPVLRYKAPSSGAYDPDYEVLGASEWLRAKEKDLMLMAAAPELLDALEEMKYARTDKALKMADAAIAKALGAEKKLTPQNIKPCPFCGRDVDTSDALYVDSQGKWILECTHDCGHSCGASMRGDSTQDVYKKWNRRAD